MWDGGGYWCGCWGLRFLYFEILLVYGLGCCVRWVMRVREIDFEFVNDG